MNFSFERLFCVRSPCRQVRLVAEKRNDNSLPSLFSIYHHSALYVRIDARTSIRTQTRPLLARFLPPLPPRDWLRKRTERGFFLKRQGWRSGIGKAWGYPREKKREKEASSSFLLRYFSRPLREGKKRAPPLLYLTLGLCPAPPLQPGYERAEEPHNPFLGQP